MLHEHVGYVNSAAFEHMLVGILASSQQTELLERMDLHPDAQLENPLSNAASRHTNSSSVEEKYRRTCSFDSCIHWKREPIPLKIALCPEHVCMSFYYAGAAVVPDVATHVALCFSLQSQPFDFSSVFCPRGATQHERVQSGSVAGLRQAVCTSATSQGL